jgi:hypothetical protein
MKYLTLVFLVVTVSNSVNSLNLHPEGSHSNSEVLRARQAQHMLDVMQYLINNGYITPHYTQYEMRKALRQLQRENNLTVTGRITDEVVDFIKLENNRAMVIKYLKDYNYILGAVTPHKITDAIKLLQENTGYLSVTGEIDHATIQFVKTHPIAFSEGLFAPE